MTFKTASYCTRNETGKHEVEIVHYSGFWRWLFRLPEHTETYVGQGGTVWYRKDTGERVGETKERVINDLVHHMQMATKYN